MTYRQMMLRRADELKAQGPGQVMVKRQTDIHEVRALKAARAALSESELFELAKLRLNVIERLDGVQAAQASVSAARPRQSWKLRLRSVADGLSDAARQNVSGRLGTDPTDPSVGLPAPVDLIDAAEAWALAHLAAGRVDTDLSVLCDAWESATVLPGA